MYLLFVMILVNDPKQNPTGYLCAIIIFTKLTDYIINKNTYLWASTHTESCSMYRSVKLFGNTGRITLYYQVCTPRTVQNGGSIEANIRALS